MSPRPIGTNANKTKRGCGFRKTQPISRGNPSSTEWGFTAITNAVGAGTYFLYAGNAPVPATASALLVNVMASESAGFSTAANIVPLFILDPVLQGAASDGGQAGVMEYQKMILASDGGTTNIFQLAIIPGNGTNNGWGGGPGNNRFGIANTTGSSDITVEGQITGYVEPINRLASIYH